MWTTDDELPIGYTLTDAGATYRRKTLAERVLRWLGWWRP